MGSGIWRLSFVKDSRQVDITGCTGTNCALDGLLLNKGSAECVLSKISERDLGSGPNEYVIVLNLLSNAAFAGTDEDGDTLHMQKLSDGKWHVIGDLALVPPSVLKAKLKLKNCLWKKISYGY